MSDQVQQPQKKPKLVEKKKRNQPQKKQKIIDESAKESQFSKKNVISPESDDDNKDSDKSVDSVVQKKVTEQKKKGGKAKEPEKQKESEKVKEKEKDKKGAPKQKQTKDRKKGGGPGKAVKAPLIKEDPESLLIYMKEMNRPFTLNYLKDTLFLKVVPLAKNLEFLQKNNEIILKEVGASKVYLINQSNLPEVDKNEMEQLSKQLDVKTDNLKALNGEVTKGSELLRLQHRVMKINEIEDEIQKYESQIKEVSDKMKFYESINFVKATENEVIHAENEFQSAQDISVKRKKLYTRVIDTILEGAEMTVQEFEAIVGISRE